MPLIAAKRAASVRINTLDEAGTSTAHGDVENNVGQGV